MPELPEVETTRSGIEPHILNQVVEGIEVRQRSLRWPIPDELGEVFSGETISEVSRRAKYLLLRGRQHTLIIHLGMSG
ncbi:MAG: DNA-formamidopyrimidine glycosylase, partial [Proteobacteria bacterium]|nr:DNA-formamidopyrimidine glycosylase [Pseudomonadota bacterium]